MKWQQFHHPDWSLPVVKRRLSEEWIDVMKDVGDILLTNGRSLTWNHSYPSRTAFNMAMSRLRKQGLMVQYTDEVHLPRLKLTNEGLNSLPIYHTPHKRWDSKWNGIWYLLIFDVPESERPYRDNLRRFLKKLNMGCLQKSVWITPRDIRPEYDDLDQAANVHAVSYLLESRTVLHRETSEIVESAWNFDRLHELHDRYVRIYRNNLNALRAAQHETTELMELLYQEAEAYIQCMHQDPLLPSTLLPETYQGKQVFALHTRFRKALAEALLADNK
ncbi:PaaX family transcriptional regulator C-terminal domain-containing protein [Pontiellaceae bacterium B12219]|nr:PaaX family transcriptional regulator C-terminal domain-containing protein [Pontiellaceae bacterium B12219]